MPDVTKTASGYHLNFKDFRVLIVATHISTSVRDGRVSAEFAIETNAPGYAGLLHRSRVNLLSTRGRKELCKELETRFEAPWAEIIEQASSIVLERIRAGEPLQWLSTDIELQPTEYLIGPLMPLNQITTVFGLPGSMKSYTAILSCILSTLPWHDNNLEFKVPEKSHLALYLDWESSYDLVNHRLTKTQTGHDLPLIKLPYRHCALPLADDIEQIKKMAIDTNAKFLIIDSLGGACGGDIYAPEPALRFFGALRTIPDITTLILAHTSKELSKEKTILGTVYFWAYSRMIWETKSSQEPGQNEVTIGLFNRKANEDQLHIPLGLRFIFTPDTVNVMRADVKESFLEQLSLTQQIKEVLKGGALSLAEIAEATGTKKDVLSMTLSRMKSKGEAVRLPDNKWGLPNKE